MNDFDGYMAARSPGLLRFAWLLTGDAHEAEDVVQTVLARLSLRWDRVARSDDVDAYVRRCIINASRSRFRRKRLPQVPLEEALTVGHEAAYSTIDDRAGLAHALSCLSVRQRQVVVLRYLEDLSEADTAKVLDCAVGTVKSTSSRALAKLREHPALAVEPAENRRNR